MYLIIKNISLTPNAKLIEFFSILEVMNYASVELLLLQYRQQLKKNICIHIYFISADKFILLFLSSYKTKGTKNIIKIIIMKQFQLKLQILQNIKFIETNCLCYIE